MNFMKQTVQASILRTTNHFIVADNSISCVPRFMQGNLLRCVSLVVPNVTNSENSRLHEDGNVFPNGTQKSYTQ